MAHLGKQSSRNVADFIWDDWFVGLKLMYVYQSEMANLTLQTIEYQKEVWAQTMENTMKIEQETKNFFEDIKNNYQNNTKNPGSEQAARAFEEWNQHLNEFFKRIQLLTATPATASLTTVNKSQEQMEASFKSLIEQQKKIREEIKSLMVNFVNEIKMTQREMAASFEAIDKNKTINTRSEK